MVSHVVTGSGTRKEIKPGVWRVRFSLGRDPITGGYEYSPWRTVHTTSKRELNRFCDDYKRELNEGVAPARSHSPTLASQLELYHLGRKGSVKDSYFEREGQLVKKARLLFGEARMGDVDAAFVAERYAYARENSLMSESDLLMVHRLLSRFYKRELGKGRRARLASENPVAYVEAPNPHYRQRVSLSADQAVAFKRALLALEDREETGRDGAVRKVGRISKEVAAMALLETGARRGEVLGLMWKDAHLEGAAPYLDLHQQVTKELRVTSLKSEMSNRHLAISPWFAQYLREWKEVQAEILARSGVAQTPDSFVAHAVQVAEVDAGGAKVKVAYAGFIAPRNFNRWFEEFCADNGFGRYTEGAYERVVAGRTIHRGRKYEGLTPHGLRHTQATLLISAGEDVKTVQQRLGHQDASLTLRTYAHAVRENDARAAARFDAILAGAEG